MSTEQPARPVWTLRLDPAAQKQLDKLSPPDFARIDAAILAMRADPMTDNVKRLRDFTPAFRRRVGNYRILFDIDQTARVVIIAAVVRRTSTTYRKRRR